MLLHHPLEYLARERPDHPLAELGTTTIDYAAADVLANRFANSLSALGLVKGDRIAYLSKNSIELIIMYYGCSKAGVIPVPLNYRLAPRECLYIVNDAECTAMFSETEFVSGLETVRDEMSTVKHFICVGSEQPINTWQPYQDWLGADSTHPKVAISDAEQVYQMYTSGTTGNPKGAMISHRNVTQNIQMAILHGEMGVAADRNLIVAPLYHAAAAVTAMCMVAMGSTLVILAEFDPVNVVNAMEAEKITMSTLVPAMIQACLVNVPDLAERDLSSLRRITYGANPIAKETLQAGMEKFACDFNQGFGMTELTCLATSLTPDVHRQAVAGDSGLLLSAGRAVAGTEMIIADENDNEVPRGTVGEILIKGPHVMMGYWKKPEATEKTLKGGWMHTGDAAYMDEDGFIYIQDRIKDMIVSGAENIYPAEIESVLFEHSAVADAAVVGIPDEKFGEAVLAFIVLKEGEEVTAEAIDVFCRERLAGYKVPRKVEFIDIIPRNASGKVLKRSLREPYWEGVERRVG
jgi:acyl-CoA synthetase (AMP-forming)/AMP-acid ligase II